MDNHKKYIRSTIISFVPFFTLLALALTYVIIVEQKLWKITVYSVNNGQLQGQAVFGTCYLQDNYMNSASACNYAYILGTATIFGSLIISIATCCARQIPTAITYSVFSGLTAVWWIIGASFMTDNIRKANDFQVPQEYWRQVILGLGWAQVCVAILSTITSIYHLHVVTNIENERQRQLYNTNPQIVNGTPVYDNQQNYTHHGVQMQQFPQQQYSQQFPQQQYSQQFPQQPYPQLTQPPPAQTM
jgi:hypothetical protein